MTTLHMFRRRRYDSVDLATQYHFRLPARRPTLAPAPYSLDDLSMLKAALLFGDDDLLAQRQAGEILVPQTEAILDAWYGFVAAHDFLLASFASPDGPRVNIWRGRASASGQRIPDRACTTVPGRRISGRLAAPTGRARTGRTRPHPMDAVIHPLALSQHAGLSYCYDHSTIPGAGNHGCRTSAAHGVGVAGAVEGGVVASDALEPDPIRVREPGSQAGRRQLWTG